MKISARARSEAIEALMECAESWSSSAYDGTMLSDQLGDINSDPRRRLADAAFGVVYGLDLTSSRNMADVYAGAASLLYAGWTP